MRANPSAWTMDNVYALFGLRHGQHIPPEAQGERVFHGLTVKLLSAADARRRRSRAMGRIVVECGCGKVLSYGRVEQYARACPAASAALVEYVIPSLDDLADDALDAGSTFDREEIEAFAEYCRAAWESIPKVPKLQNAMTATWQDERGMLVWSQSRLWFFRARLASIPPEIFRHWVLRFRVVIDAPNFTDSIGTFITYAAAEMEGEGWLAENGRGDDLSYEVVDVWDGDLRGHRPANIPYPSSVHPGALEDGEGPDFLLAAEVADTGAWEPDNNSFTDSGIYSGAWIFLGTPPWPTR